MIYNYQNGLGLKFIDLDVEKIVDDLISLNESGKATACLHFWEGTQLAISFLDGVPVLQLNREPQVKGIILLIVQNLGRAFRDAKICSKEDFIGIYERELKRISNQG